MDWAVGGNLLLTSPGEMITVITGQIAMDVAANGMIDKRPRWVHLQPISGSCMTCATTCMNGYRIAGKTVTRGRQVTAVPELEETAAGAWFELVPGSSNHGSCVPPTDLGTPIRSATPTLGFVWPGICRTAEPHDLIQVICLIVDSNPVFFESPNRLAQFCIVGRVAVPEWVGTHDLPVPVTVNGRI